jgi:uncharacterized ParB-like nuclease family protein
MKFKDFWKQLYKAKDDIKWITVRGRHIPIKEGQDVEDAIGEAFAGGKKKPAESQGANLYHGTSSESASTIRREGLKGELISLSEDRRTASKYAEAQQGEVVEIKRSALKLPDIQTEKGYQFQRKLQDYYKKNGLDKFEEYLKKNKENFAEQGYDAVYFPDENVSSIYVLRDIKPDEIIQATEESKPITHPKVAKPKAGSDWTGIIGLDKIKEDKRWAELTSDWGKSQIDKLKNDMKAGKEIEPIKVIPEKQKDGKYKYVIVDGQHRYNAAKEMGYSHIGVEIMGEEPGKKPRTFKSWWISKKMTPSEVQSAQGDIRAAFEDKKPARGIIGALQTKYPAKLPEKWQAERVFRTEAKKIESDAIKEDAEVMEIDKFQIILSPDPCPLCRSVTGDGDRIFDKSQLSIKGREIPPIHPNCRCILLPLV